MKCLITKYTLILLVILPVYYSMDEYDPILDDEFGNNPEIVEG